MNLLCTRVGQNAVPNVAAFRFSCTISKVFALAVLPSLCLCAYGQSSVTLAWNASTSSGVSGYKVYRGAATGNYNLSVNPGNVTQATIGGLVPGATYCFAVSAYSTDGVESPLSAEISFTTPTNSRPPDAGLTFAADSGALTGPFSALNGVLSQTLLTTLVGSGKATYPFTIVKSGTYVISANVYAPSTSENSFYVNIDAEPTDPAMIWNVAVSTGFTNRNVSWQGNGTSNNPQYNPRVFALSAGLHQLIIRGKEPNTKLQALTITPANATLEMAKMPGNVYLLSGLAPIGRTYEVQATRDFKTWSVIRNVAPDSSGVFSLVDPAAPGLASRFYRLRQTSP
jgi:hypothetical protein